MPRTYSFDHFTALNPGVSQRRRPSLKEARATDAPGRAADVRYGHAFSETSERYHAHERERELEELGRERATENAPEKRAPIGALPPTREPHPLSVVREALDDAQRQWRTLKEAARDFSRAGRRLAGLPREVAKLSIRRWMS